MPIDADVKGGYGSPGNRPNDPRGQTRGGDGLQRSVQNRFQFNPIFSPPPTTTPSSDSSAARGNQDRSPSPAEMFLKHLGSRQNHDGSLQGC